MHAISTPLDIGFNTIGELIMREVEERIGDRAGIVLGGRSTWNIRYANDTTLVTRSGQACGEVGEVLREASARVKLDLNKSKTQVMSVHGEEEVTIKGERIKRVKKV